MSLTPQQQIEKHFNWIRIGEKQAYKGKLRTIYRKICPYCGHDKCWIKTGLEGNAVYECTRCKRERRLG